MQIVVFTLNDKYYAFSTDKVEEISKDINCTKVPKAPKSIEGVINLRGNVVTLVNLSNLLHQNEDKCYNDIIIHNDEQKIGFMVKNVVEVIDIEMEEIQKLTDDSLDAALGIVHTEDGIINIIDIDNLLLKNEGYI